MLYSHLYMAAPQAAPAAQPKPEAPVQNAPADGRARPQLIATDAPTWTQVVAQAPAVTMRPRAATAPQTPTAVTMAPARPCNGQVIQQVVGSQQRACSPPIATWPNHFAPRRPVPKLVVLGGKWHQYRSISCAARP